MCGHSIIYAPTYTIIFSHDNDSEGVEKCPKVVFSHLNSGRVVLSPGETLFHF